MNFRRCLFWTHLGCGLVAGIVILMMSVTGVLLTYERQMINWADRAGLPPITVSSELASLDSILTAARNHAPETAATALTVSADPQAPLAVALGRERVLYFDPYSGLLLGEGSQPMRHFVSVTRGVHRWFNVVEENRPAARAITGAANVVFAFLVLSGIYLWFPRVYSWMQFRLRILLRRNYISGRARDFNWHHVFGFWSCLPLFLIIMSGVVISYPWASDLVYRVFDEEPPPRAENRRPAPGSPLPAAGAGIPGGQLDMLLRHAQREAGERRTITLNLPAAPVDTLSFIVDRGDGGQPQLQSTLTLDSASGEIRSHERFGDLSPARRTRAVLRRLHTGEVFGFAGQTVAGLAALAACLLVWTGLALAYRRLLQPLYTRKRS